MMRTSAWVLPVLSFAAGLCLGGTGLTRRVRAWARRDSRTRALCKAPTSSSATSPAPGGGGLDLVVFTLIVDDLVFPDGSTQMEVLGGGGAQTAFGYRLWTRRRGHAVGLCGGVGPDLPEKCRAWLRDAGVDAGGLLPGPRPTPRSWQIQEADGRRTSVWRTPAGPELFAMLRPSLEGLPPAYTAARCYHLAVHPNEPPHTLIAQLRAATSAAARSAVASASSTALPTCLVSVEPFMAAERALTAAEACALCSAGDVFSPNEEEAASIVGPGAPLQVAERLMEAGARVVALRRGEHGSLVACAASGEVWQIPAVLDVPIVDVLGCGNAYCGGFLAGLACGEPLGRAGLWGSVAASFMAGARGTVHARIEDLEAEAAERLRRLEAGAICLRPARSAR